MSRQDVTWREFTEDELAEKRRLFKPTSPEIKLLVSSVGHVAISRRFAVEGGARKLKEMSVRKDDVWIVTYPKTGTTLTQELVWQIVYGVDKEHCRQNIDERMPHLEYIDICPHYENSKPSEDLPLWKRDPYAFAETLEGPRILKTHLPLEFLPDDLLNKGKVVYVCRNPIDIAVSYAHHQKIIRGFEGSVEDFFEPFMKGNVLYGDYWFNLKSAWKHRDHPNMKFLWYEDIRADLPNAIRQLADFLGQEMDDGEIAALSDLMQIDNYRKQYSKENSDKMERRQDKEKLIRSGAVGNWRDKADDPKWSKLIAWVEKNVDGTDLPIALN